MISLFEMMNVYLKRAFSLSPVTKKKRKRKERKVENYHYVSHTHCSREFATTNKVYRSIFLNSFYSFELTITRSEFDIIPVWRRFKRFLLHHFYVPWHFLKNNRFLTQLLGTAQLTSKIIHEVQMYVIGQRIIVKMLPSLHNSIYFQICAVNFHNSKFFRKLTIIMVQLLIEK